MNSALDRLKTLLREEWDPLELMPHLPADEYDSYALVVFDCLSAGASVEDIQNYLASTARDQIGAKLRETATGLLRKRLGHSWPHSADASSEHLM